MRVRAQYNPDEEINKCGQQYPWTDIPVYNPLFGDSCGHAERAGSWVKEYSMLNVIIPRVGNELSALPEMLGLRRKDMDNGSIA